MKGGREGMREEETSRCKTYLDRLRQGRGRRSSDHGGIIIHQGRFEHPSQLLHPPLPLPLPWFGGPLEFEVEGGEERGG